MVLMHLFGGGSAELFSRSVFRTVDSTIAEPARAEAVTQSMERMNELLASMLEKRKQTFEQLSKIDLKIDSQEVSYDKMLDQLWQVRRETGEKYVEQIFVMREHMTREEWLAAFANTEE